MNMTTFSLKMNVIKVVRKPEFVLFPSALGIHVSMANCTTPAFWQVNFYPANKILRHLPWRELKISFCERGSIYKHVNSLALRNRYGESVTNAEQTVNKGNNNKFLLEEKS